MARESLQKKGNRINELQLDKSNTYNKIQLMMKNLLSFFFLICSFQLFAQYDSIFIDGSYRTYLLHLPTDYNGSNELPMVIAMHGGFGSGPQLETQSKLSEKADEADFIVVYPEGVSSPLNIRTWNAGGCCGYSMNNNIDDVGFISSLIDSLSNDLAVDTDRIYATGMSNGAFMSYRLACEIPEKIAAIAPVAGTMNVDLCIPSRAVPIIQFHSFEDSNVPYLGGIGDGVSSHYNPPIDSVQNAWAVMNNCLIINDTLYTGSDFTHIRWSDCDCMYEQQFYITTDGGHSWPGGMQTPIGDPPSEYINANDLMWDFFQMYSLECETTNINEESENNWKMKVFPNPAKNSINIQIPSEVLKEGLLNILDVNGKVVFSKKVTTSLIHLDLSKFSDGIYFIRFKSEDFSITEKFLKTNR
jgi:polyhydroxybutyrate depolymerase